MAAAEALMPELEWETGVPLDVSIEQRARNRALLRFSRVAS